jgi:hypothetical protein
MRGWAPSFSKDATTWRATTPSTPPATSKATRRVRMPVLPGRASSDSKGDGG